MARTREEYVGLAEKAILELLDQEHAAVRPEIEWKISDRQWGDAPCTLDPHHVTTALQRLAHRGWIERVTARTRGGRSITVYQPADTAGRTRKVGLASARKRLLHTRYLGWATGTGAATSGKGIVGAAGESVVHASLQASNGITLVPRSGGEVRSFLGSSVPGGSLDNAGFLLTLDQTTGMPSVPYALPVEVKNVRQWVYPQNRLLYQLLYKAAMLQQMHPRSDFVPILVCRKAHYLTNVMAKSLGFYVISTLRQYIRPLIVSNETDRRAFEEVRDELGYHLVPHDTAVPEMVSHFTDKVPRLAKRTADNWRFAGAQFSELYGELREKISHKRRSGLFDELAFHAGTAIGESVDWHRDDTVDFIDLDEQPSNGED
jgi:hypothetical protein